MIVEELSKYAGVDASYVWKVVRSASHRYKTYLIKKKDGGNRKIDHPARELKLFQRWLAENVFGRMPTHAAACAYRVGSSTRVNAALHIKNDYILRVDFQDFFPSITEKDIGLLIEQHAERVRHLVRTVDDIEVIKRLVCKDGAITIGAPSSPIVSNVIMFNFDSEWHVRCADAGITYSRYADDLYMSTDQRNLLTPLLQELRNNLRNMGWPRLRINDKKTIFSSRKRRRLVTGLVLTSDNALSLGRPRKRLIKSFVFRHLNGKLGQDQTDYLRGFISYARSVEPDFVDSLRRKYEPKYGAAALKELYI